MKRALFVGRFQPFHNGHFKVVKMLLSKYDEAILVVGSAECPATSDNPFTAGERIEMIRACFGKNELARLIIVPLRDVNDNSRWVTHLVSHLPEFHSLYSNNPLVKTLFKNAGMAVKVKHLEFFDRENCEATKLRADMARGGREWKKHVPKAVARHIEKINGIERLRGI